MAHGGHRLIGALLLGQVLRPLPAVLPTSFSEYGFAWEQRLGHGLGLGSPYGGTVSRYASSGFPDASSTRRISLDGESESCGLKLAENLGWGRYTVSFAVNSAGLDPNANVAVWLYDDRIDKKGGQEIDFEMTRWGDSNNPMGLHLGVIDRQVRFGSVAKFPARPSIYWRVTLGWTPTKQWVLAETHQHAHSAVYDAARQTTTVSKMTPKWIIAGYGEWACPSPEIGATLRIAVMKNAPLMWPQTQRVRTKIIVADVKFTPETP